MCKRYIQKFWNESDDIDMMRFIKYRVDRYLWYIDLLTYTLKTSLLTVLLYFFVYFQVSFLFCVFFRCRIMSVFKIYFYIYFFHVTFAFVVLGIVFWILAGNLAWNNVSDMIWLCQVGHKTFVDWCCYTEVGECRSCEWRVDERACGGYGSGTSPTAGRRHYWSSGGFHV